MKKTISLILSITMFFSVFANALPVFALAKEDVVLDTAAAGENNFTTKVQKIINTYYNKFSPSNPLTDAKVVVDDFYLKSVITLDDVSSVKIGDAVLSTTESKVSVGNKQFVKVSQYVYDNTSKTLKLLIPELMTQTPVANKITVTVTATDGTTQNVVITVPSRTALSVKEVVKGDTNPWEITNVKGTYTMTIDYKATWKYESWMSNKKMPLIIVNFNEAIDKANDPLFTKKISNGKLGSYGITAKENAKQDLAYYAGINNQKNDFTYVVSTGVYGPATIKFSFPTENPVADSIVIEQGAKTVISKGGELQLTTKVSPVSLGDVTFTSSDNKVATVDNTGKVKSLAVGSTYITATYATKTAKILVTVEPVQTAVDAELNKDLDAAIKDINQKDTKIIVDAKNKLDAAIFDELKKTTDKSITLDVTNVEKLAYSWTFNSKDINKAGIELPIGLKIEKEAPAKIKEEVQKATGNQESLFLNFEYHGDLPGKATIKAYVGDKYKVGESLFLYFYNETTKQVEFIKDKVVVDKEGYVTFDITHCSTYITTNALMATAINNPQTSDMNMFVIGGISILGLLGIGFSLKKRFN